MFNKSHHEFKLIKKYKVDCEIIKLSIKLMD